MCLCVGFWGVSLTWNSLGFLDLKNCFYSLGKWDYHHCLFKYVFVPFLFSFWDAYMWMLACFILSHKSLRLPSPSFFFPLFALIWWVSVPCLWVHWSFILFHVVSCWNSLTYFSIQLLYSSTQGPLFGTYIFHIFVEVLNVFMHSFPEFVSIFVTITLNSSSGKLLISASLGFFPEAVSCSFLFQTYYYLSSFYLIVFVCFYALDEIATSSVLKGWLCVGGEPYCSTLPLFLVVSHNFVITQAVNFISYSSQ